jgi:hypothetical protein
MLIENATTFSFRGVHIYQGGHQTQSKITPRWPQILRDSPVEYGYPTLYKFKKKLYMNAERKS